MKKLTKRISALVLSLIAVLTPAIGQDDTASASKTFTLQQCIDFALENHGKIKNAQLDFDKSRMQVKETTTIGMPHVNGKIDLMANPAIQKAFVPANAFDPSAPDDMVIGLDFGLPYSTNANLTLTQLIFDGSYFVGLRAASTYTELFEKSIDQTKTEVVESVMKAYYAVLVNEERLKLIQRNEEQLQILIDESQLMFDNGFIEKLDLQRLQVSQNTLIIEIQKLKSFIGLSYDLLKFQMGMPFESELKLAETFDDALGRSSMDESTSEFTATNRIEHQLMNVQLDLNQLAYENEKVKIYPSVGAFAQAGMNYGALNFGDAMNVGNWEPFSMIGLSVDVPIWSSFRRKHRMDMAQVDIEKTQNDITELERALTIDFLQSKMVYNDNLKVMQIQEQNMQLAEAVYNAEQEKYKAGVGSNFQVVQSETSLQEAQTNYYNSVYEALVSKVALEKALGNLNQN